MDLSLDDARKMADNCLGIAAEMTLKPITVAVLDAAGDLKVLLRQDGTSTLRPDIAQGKATMPLVKALATLGPEPRQDLWRRVHAKSQDPDEVRAIIGVIEACGALDACVAHANQLVDDAWRVLDPLVEDSLPKIMLRAFGWYVLERHY